MDGSHQGLSRVDVVSHVHTCGRVTVTGICLGYLMLNSLHHCKRCKDFEMEVSSIEETLCSSKLRLENARRYSLTITT